MENTIRNSAIGIYKLDVIDDLNIVCRDDLSSYSNPYFLDEDKQFFRYRLVGTKIASESAHPADLTSSKIVVTNFSISCYKKSIYSPASILLGFDICYDTGSGGCASTRPEEATPTLHYQTRIKLRNY